MKSPAFQYYPKDLLVDTAMLTNEQVGAYWRLVSYAWIGLPGYKQCELPSEPESLARLVGLDVERWLAIASPVVQLFSTNGDGKLIQKRLKKEAVKQKKWVEKSREGGVKSGQSRRKAAKGGSVLVEPPAQPKGNSSSASSSSSSEELKEPETSVSERGAAKAVKPKSEPDPLLDSPAVKLFRDKVRLTPSPGITRERIAGEVTDLELWGRVMDAWKLRGFKPMNIEGQLAWYHSGIPEYNGGQRNGNGQQREVGEARPVPHKYSDVGVRPDPSKTR